MYQIHVSGGWMGGRDDLAAQFVETILRQNGLAWTYVPGGSKSILDVEMSPAKARSVFDQMKRESRRSGFVVRTGRTAASVTRDVRRHGPPPEPEWLGKPYTIGGIVIGRLKARTATNQPTRLNVIILRPGEVYGLGGAAVWGEDGIFGDEPGIFFFLDVPSGKPDIHVDSTGKTTVIGDFVGSYYLTTIMNRPVGSDLRLGDPEGQILFASVSGQGMDLLFAALERRFPDWRKWIHPYDKPARR